MKKGRIHLLMCCLSEVRSSFLQIHENKTEIFLIGTAKITLSQAHSGSLHCGTATSHCPVMQAPGCFSKMSVLPHTPWHGAEYVCILISSCLDFGNTHTHKLNRTLQLVQNTDTQNIPSSNFLLFLRRKRRGVSFLRDTRHIQSDQTSRVPG